MEQTEPIQPASCNTCGKVPPEELIGRAGEPIRCLAMGAGGFDSAMQLGVAHAMVVSDSKPPDVVVGISMGAVNGTALAEILDGESDAMAAPSRRELQLSRFRTFLYAAQDLNETLAAATAPDMYEADAGHVLEPHHLAIHFKNERTARQQALRARSGMVLLINTLVTLRISIGTLVRFIRCVLGLRASGELPPLKRAGVRIRELFRILHTVLFNLRSCGELLYAVFWGAIRASVMRLDTDYYPDRGSTAGEIIFRFRVFRKIARLLRWTVAIVLFAAFLWVLVRHWIATPVVVVALVILLHIVLKQGRPSRYMRLLRWLRDANLARYDLLRDLASPYVIEEILVRLFDKDYYGHVRMEEVVEAAFGHNAVQDPGRDSGYGHQPRSFKRYRERSGIHVVPMVGDLGKGELSSVDPDTPVVKGLLAATAIVPWLRPVELGNSLFIDGANVSNEPVAALVGHLRSHIHPEVTAAFVYPVSHLPIEQEHIPTSRGEMYSGLVDVVTRAQQLQAFRHARLERKLIRLYARVLGETRQPPETIKSGVGQPRALHCFGPVGTRDRHFIRADLFPIEPETKPITVARHLLRTTTKDEKQRVIAAAVADGCRLTLERIIPEAVRGDGTTTEVRCAQVLARRRGEKIEGFPGASEVCSQCALNRKSEDPDQVSPQTLRILQKYHAPEWPRRDSPKETAWHPQTAPRKERQEPADHKPQVGLLFSGGVFRGVFLVGVLNALNELRIKPTI
ncbi:MAG: hypothetical protein JWO56_983, partial [Acidobacteria bacterium]|nr:hypothetical protein [Acidobacteriota bacterium]